MTISVCSTRGARTSATRCAPSATARAGNGFTAAVRGEYAENTAGTLSGALAARNGRIGLADRPQGLELGLTISAIILIDWHRFAPSRQLALFYLDFPDPSTQQFIGLRGRHTLGNQLVVENSLRGCKL